MNGPLTVTSRSYAEPAAPGVNSSRVEGLDLLERVEPAASTG
jgi:hypothetical protein